MKNGKKYKAYKILYKTLNIMKTKIAQSQSRFPGLGPLSTCDASSIFSNFFTERAKSPKAPIGGALALKR